MGAVLTNAHADDCAGSLQFEDHAHFIASSSTTWFASEAGAWTVSMWLYYGGDGVDTVGLVDNGDCGSPSLSVYMEGGNLAMALDTDPSADDPQFYVSSYQVRLVYTALVCKANRQYLLTDTDTWTKESCIFISNVLSVFTIQTLLHYYNISGDCLPPPLHFPKNRPIYIIIYYRLPRYLNKNYHAFINTFVQICVSQDDQESRDNKNPVTLVGLNWHQNGLKLPH